MKPTIFQFDKPVKILQIFRNINNYKKTEKSVEERKDKIEWKKFESKSGFVKNGILYLPETIMQNPGIKRTDLITIEDNQQKLENTPNNLILKNKASYPNCYSILSNRFFDLTHSNTIDIFRIHKKEQLELFLEYGYWEIGIPERNNFKLCEIVKDKPIEVKINGKNDFSMSGRRERTFKEQHYIFNYMGDFNECEILKEPYPAITKEIPINRKMVNLIKELY